MEVSVQVQGNVDAHTRKRYFAFRSSRAPPSTCSHRQPIYRRTRMIETVEVVDEGESFVVLKCDCGHFYQHLCACRHIYTLLDRLP